MKPWRFRMCPSCRIVLAGGEFKPVRLGAHWGPGCDSRVCPHCGHTAPTFEFRVVRDARKKAEVA